MQISFPCTLFSASTGGGGGAGIRAVASNSNLVPYTTSTTTNRHINYSKDRILAPNASWTILRLTHNNWTKNNTSESSGVAKVIRAGILINGTFYQALYSGVAEKVMGEGLSITSDDIIIPSIAGGTNITIRTKVSYPLLYDTQTANFTVGQVVTGATSGATGIIQSQSVDYGTTGELVLLSETGTFVNNELITDPLGGSALVNMAAQTTYSTVASQAIWLEGSISSQDSSIDYTISNPVSTRMVAAAPTIVAGNITACGVTTVGVGYSNPSSVYAWQIGSDGIIYSNNIGYTNGGHTTITVTDGVPPTGLAAWDGTATVVVAGTDDFGANTSVYDACLLTGIPSTTVKSCLLNGDSISRGFSSTDSIGDIYHSFGFYERIIAQQCGIINMSTSGADYSDEILYASNFPKTYGLYMGQATHALITLGSNDTAAGASAATLATRAGILSTYIRSFGTIVGYGNLIPRGDQVIITGISQAATAVVTATNALVIGDTVTFSTDISGAGTIGGMTQIRGLTGTVTAASGTDFTVNIDSTAFTPYTSGGYAYILAVATSQIPETGFTLGGAADTYNADLGVGITSDFPVVHPRPIFQDATVTTAWKTSALLTFDTTHPTQLGHTTAAADSTLISELAFLGV